MNPDLFSRRTLSRKIVNVSGNTDAPECRGEQKSRCIPLSLSHTRVRIRLRDNCFQVTTVHRRMTLTDDNND